MSDTLKNLLAGARLALGLPLRPFRYSLTQLILLCGFGWCLAVADSFRNAGFLEFSSVGLAAEAARNYFMLVGLSLTTVLSLSVMSFVELAIPCFAAEIILWLFWMGWSITGGDLFNPVAWWPDIPPSLVEILWQLFIFVRVLRMHQLRLLRIIPAVLLYGGLLWGIHQYLPDGGLLEAEPTADDQIPVLDVESVYYSQGALLKHVFDDIKAGSGPEPALFFLGFAGVASESVFWNEVRSVGQLMSNKLGAAGRTIELVNSRETVDLLPVASASNLEYALHAIRKKMRVQSDVLVLFLTSHGTETGELVVDFDNLGLHNLRPDDLARFIDEAGIKWRIVIVSACYSGNFLSSLSNENSLVITASAADRTSFGCEHGRDWTYFGEAYFRDALNRTDDFAAAFELAASAIAKRELSEGRVPSMPQRWVGGAIARHLGSMRPAHDFPPIHAGLPRKSIQ